MASKFQITGKKDCFEVGASIHVYWRVVRCDELYMMTDKGHYEASAELQAAEAPYGGGVSGMQLAQLVREQTKQQDFKRIVIRGPEPREDPGSSAFWTGVEASDLEKQDSVYYDTLVRVAGEGRLVIFLDVGIDQPAS